VANGKPLSHAGAGIYNKNNSGCQWLHWGLKAG